MRYTYIYKTSDGIRHESSLDAPSREAAFSLLRVQGVKPIKVIAADGSKANGEVVVRGVRRRFVVLGAACLVLCAIAGMVVAYRGGSSARSSSRGIHGETPPAFLTAQTRRQVIGDAAVIEKGIRTGWADVFEHEGDRFLASFAIPGVKAGVRSTNVAALEDCLKEPNSNVSGTKAENLAIEARQIIAMVEGMKSEARAYLAAGGTAVGYGRRLTERQDTEIAIFNRAESEILAAQKTMSEDAFTHLYEQRNDELRNLGIRPVILSDKDD